MTSPRPAGSGIITPDLVADEAEEWLAASEAHDLDRIFLVAPASTEERIARTVAASKRVRLRDGGHGRHRRA